MRAVLPLKGKGAGAMVMEREWKDVAERSLPTIDHDWCGSHTAYVRDLGSGQNVRDGESARFR